MHRAISAAIVSVLLVLGATAALGDSQRQFSGEVISLDRYSKSIVVKGGEPPRRLRFFFSRSGQVTVGGKPASFDELKKGAHVDVAYTRNGGSQSAYAIAIVSGESEAIGLRQ